MPRAPEVKKLINKGGRPGWKPSEKDLDTIEALAQRGMTKRDIGHYFSFNESHWYTLGSKFPEISKRIDKGRGAGHSFVYNKLWTLINNGNKSAIFYYLDKIAGLSASQAQININNTQIGDTNNQVTNNIQFNMNEMDDQSLKMLAEQTSHLLDSNLVKAPKAKSEGSHEQKNTKSKKG